MTEYYEYKKASIYKYYNTHKDKIRARETTRVKCEICNCEIQKKHFVKHERLPKHIKNLSKSNAKSSGLLCMSTITV